MITTKTEISPAAAFVLYSSWPFFAVYCKSSIFPVRFPSVGEGFFKSETLRCGIILPGNQNPQQRSLSVKTEAKIRLLSLVGILFITIFPLIVNSIYLFAGGKSSSHPNFIYSLLWEALSLSLLYFVLHKQGRSLKDIGFEFRKTDIFHGLLLYLALYFVVIIAITISPSFLQAPQNVDFLRTKMTVSYLAFIVINPFFEELIVRAYTMTELNFLIKKEELTVLASTIIQTSYHLYQGLIPALYTGIIFFVFSIYFAKTRKIVPVILVHLLMDLTAISQLGKS
ncbi:type II CAAX endopeptidase family protein [Paenibacillus ehimensis]|uniref:CPBP family intramembrane glutamic endopeptidase n=1 Tax=Paenibacillus ehimensis TaxID=79264 RepID=UPI003D2CC727